jgi:putative transposase
MPRGARDARGGYCYHVLNRGNGRRTVFRKDGDFAAFIQLLRYIEGNPVRAGLVERAQDWLWCSAAAAQEHQPVLDPGPVRHPSQWLTLVNEPQTEAEVERLRECLRRRRPYGEDARTIATARRMDLEASLRPRGRPRKQAGQQVTWVGVDDAPK